MDTIGSLFYWIVMENSNKDGIANTSFHVFNTLCYFFS